MAAQKDKRFLPFPLYVLEDPDGERCLLPNDHQIRVAEESAEREEAALAKALGDPSRSAEIPVLRALAQSARGYAASCRELVSLRAEARALDYEVARPNFGEYVMAEERAKDWINGEPRVDRSKMMPHLLAGNVSLNGQVFTERDVREGEPDEIRALFDRVYDLAFPDPTRAPFWRSRCTT